MTSDLIELKYCQNIYAPTDHEQVEPLELKVIGEIPKEIDGSYYRNGPNPKFGGFKHYHWFDGDGMIHKIELSNGKARYQNRYVETQALRVEKKAGRKLFFGLDELMMSSPLKKMAVNTALQKFAGTNKDTSNTDLIYFRGKILCLWWLSGKPYAVDPLTLRTEGVEDFEGSYRGNASAHARVDPRTGELFFMDFGQQKNFVSVQCVTPAGRLKWRREFQLPYPRIYHDILYTEDYVVLMDFPLGYFKKPQTGKIGLGLDIHSSHAQTRIILIDRKNPHIEKVFVFPPTYVLHGINAFQKDDVLHLFVCKFVDPIVNRNNYDPLIPRVGKLRVQTVTAHWKLDLTEKDYTIRETIIDDTNSEFPKMNEQWIGRPSRYCYSPRLVRSPQVQFDAVMKYNLQTGQRTDLVYGKDWVGEEVVFIPKNPEHQESEDDGWIATVVHSQPSQESEFRIYDAKTLSNEPVARIIFSNQIKIPFGFHSKWIPS